MRILQVFLFGAVAVLMGGIAQLGERLHGMQEVSGSIPLTSTNSGGAVEATRIEFRGAHRLEA
jgi:hypothetical protein